MEVTEKLEIDLSYEPAVPFLGIIPKDSISYYTDTAQSVHGILFTAAEKWNQPRYIN